MAALTWIGRCPPAGWGHRPMLFQDLHHGQFFIFASVPDWAQITRAR